LNLTMRIVAGTLGGRQFESPRGHLTHPMSEKARAAIFNALGDIGGLSVLDPFAGSGALSFEALSRGARSALLIDNDKHSIRAINKNIGQLGLRKNAKAISANARAWSDMNKGAKFDLILADPPYNKLQIDLLERLVTHLNPDGVFVLSWPGSQSVPVLEATEQIKTNFFGDAKVVFYRLAAT
jgi:16S rRNA (guanine966-N2)-methyltransferase